MGLAMVPAGARAQDIPQQQPPGAVSADKGQPAADAGDAQPAAEVSDTEADAQLKALIPDDAVANPQGWATSSSAPGATPAATTIDPGAPLADIPAMSVPWPDSLPAPAALAALPADPAVTAEVAQDEAAQAAARSGLRQRGARQDVAVSDHLKLVFPADLAAFPERDAFLARFRELSTLRKYDSDSGSIAQVAARARADRELIEKLMRIYGYYDSVVTQTVGGGDLGDDKNPQVARVTFNVLPGDRYRFGAVDLGNLAQTGPDYAALREGFGIKAGDFLDNDRIVAQRNKLDTDLGETGHAFAKVGNPELTVDHKREEGDLALAVDPGGKYRFGRVVSDRPRFLSSRHLEEIARFEPGDLYQRSLQEDLKRAILATGLVASVTVTPRETVAAPVPTPAVTGPGQTGEVALDVALVPGKLRTVAGLIGYESGDGFRLEGSWEHRNFFPPEGMLRVRGIAGTKEQLLGSTVRWNNFHGRDQVLTLDLYADTVARDAYTARTVAFTSTFEKLTTLLFQKPWVWSVGLQVLATQERESAAAGQSVPRNTYFIGALPLRGAFDRSDNLLDPTRGWRASLSVSPEVSRQLDGPTVTYARVQFDASGYKPVTDKVVMAARVRLGSIPGTALENIAPSRRFYAGGGGSVRGYGYQEIGPRDTAGDPSGGRSLTEFSLEARVSTGLMGGALQLVPFVDAGTVAESITPTLSGMRYGAGLGLRYKTGFGPIRVDVGTPLNPRPGDSRVTVSVALGQAF